MEGSGINIDLTTDEIINIEASLEVPVYSKRQLVIVEGHESTVIDSEE